MIREKSLTITTCPKRLVSEEDKEVKKKGLPLERSFFFPFFFKTFSDIYNFYNLNRFSRVGYRSS